MVSVLPTLGASLSYNIMYDVNFSGKTSREEVNTRFPAWIHSSAYDNTKPSVILIHGYAGVRSDFMPVAVLRDGECELTEYNP